MILCAIYVNFEFLTNTKEWYYGATTLDKFANFSIHLLSLMLSFTIMGIELEWQQLMSVLPIFRTSWFSRSLIYILLAATTYNNDKTFYLYDFTTNVCIGLFVVASIYAIGILSIEVNKLFKPIKVDDTL